MAMLMLSFLASPLLVSACRQNASTAQTSRAPAVEALTEKRILFAHQSVGADIMAGIAERFTDEKMPLRIVQASDLPADGGYFAHAFNGGNGDFHGKLDDFARLLAAGPGHGADIAIFKFCYLDLPADADAEGLFQRYRQRMGELEQTYPQLRLIHCTVPLTRRQTGPKAWLKRLLERPVTGVEDNLVRARFNDLLRHTYGDAVFDLAAAESTWPDGRREIVSRGEATGYALVPDYTDDDGHLNRFGQQVVAERFLSFLLNL
ncbi:MAG: hypothetical protein WDA20_03625 [Desulfuromonadales bacterium]